MDYARALQTLAPDKQWSIGDTYESLQWLDAGEPPTKDALEAAWLEYKTAADARKTWPNAQAFMSQFTFPELCAIASSADATVKGFMLKLSTWFSPLESDNAEVAAALALLVGLGLLTEARKSEILAK